LSLKQLRKS